MILEGIFYYLVIRILRYFLYDTSFRWIYYILTAIIIIGYIMNNIDTVIDFVSDNVSPFVPNIESDDDTYKPKRALQYNNAS